MNITITGNLGSGKSSICKMLKERGYEIISTGTIFRELAIEHNMSVEDFNRKVHEDTRKGDHSVDALIDQRTTRMNTEKDNVVFDSRLAWNFAPGSFKVFVIVDINEAARRVYHDSLRKESESYESQEECRAGLRNRQDIENKRFKEIYHIDYFDMGNYNLVIESTNTTTEALVEEILLRFEEFKEGVFENLVELNPVSVYPTRKLAECMDGGAGKNGDAGKNGGAGKDGSAGKDGRQQAAMSSGTFYAQEDHTLLVEALREGKEFMSVRVVDFAEQGTLTAVDYAEFEATLGFRYRSYPKKKEMKDSNLLIFPKIHSL